MLVLYKLLLYNCREIIKVQISIVQIMHVRLGTSQRQIAIIL